MITAHGRVAQSSSPELCHCTGFISRREGGCSLGDGKAGLSTAGRSPASCGGISPPTPQQPIPWFSVLHMGRNFSWEEKVSEISCCRCYADFNVVMRGMKYLWLMLVPCVAPGEAI